MSNLTLTPSILRRIDSNLRVIVSSAWQRRASNSWWARVTKTRTSSTKTELLQWLLEQAKIFPLGSGGNFTFEDLSEVYWEIVNEGFGAGLKLTRDEIEDALGSPYNQGNALDRAAAWARQMGSAGAYWPQQQVVSLLKNGKTNLGYDKVAFFSAAHPVDPYEGASGPYGTYQNLFTGYPFSALNLARITAYIQTIKGPDGIVRNLVPRIVATGPELKFTVSQVLGAEIYADPNNANGSPGSNVIKLAYDYTAPISAPELADAGVWYLFCELMEDDELGGLIYQERRPYELNSYAPVNDAELGRKLEFQWLFHGRNAASYGHPFLAFRVEPTGAANLPSGF